MVTPEDRLRNGIRWHAPGTPLQGLLGGVHFLGLLNNAAVKACIQVFGWTCFRFSGELRGLMVRLAVYSLPKQESWLWVRPGHLMDVLRETLPHPAR